METHEQAYLGSSPSTCVIIMMGCVPAVLGWDAGLWHASLGRGTPL